MSLVEVTIRAKQKLFDLTIKHTQWLHRCLRSEIYLSQIREEKWQKQYSTAP